MDNGKLRLELAAALWGAEELKNSDLDANGYLPEFKDLPDSDKERHLWLAGVAMRAINDFEKRYGI